MKRCCGNCRYVIASRAGGYPPLVECLHDRQPLRSKHAPTHVCGQYIEDDTR